MKSAKIVILLATFNRSHLILETLDSIAKQSFFNWECIIVDDFSSDNTASVVRNYIAKDARFSLHKKPKGMNKGLSASRNFGLVLAGQREKTNFIQFFDDDDLMHPRKLELQVKSFLDNPSAQFVICGAKNFVETEEITWEENVKPISLNSLSFGEAYLLGEVRFVAQVPLFRYEYAKNFRFDEDLFYAEEWVLFSQLFLKQAPVYTQLSKTLFYRKKHLDSQTERTDKNFKRRKALTVADLKILDYINEQNIHTRITLYYFTRKFLVYKYDSGILDSLEKEIKLNKNTSRTDYRKFLLARKIHWFTRKFILRILKF